jgi:hypothetical protein
VPGVVAQVADDGLHQQAGDRRGQPEQGKIVGIGAQRGENAADVGVLQRETELNAEEAEAHVPQLPERQYGLVTGRMHAARPDFKICRKITRPLCVSNERTSL